ncbi:MAG: hypothetical protein EOM49_10275 [Epsilonproteobacteria bacterium]|nr:hypothetical protein [Campylobacterota bacterium]
MLFSFRWLLLEYAVRSLFRRFGKNFFIFFILSFLIFILSSVLMIAESINLNPANWQQISAIIASAALDEKQKKQWRKAVELKQSLTSGERECKRLERAVQVAIDNQSRTRSNMGRIDRNTEFFQQLTKRLAEESMTIDKLQREVVEAQGQADNSRRELEAYLNNLQF